MIGHYRLTLIGRSAEKKSVRLGRFHAPEGGDVLAAAKLVVEVLGKLSEVKRLSVTRITMERVDANGHVV